MMIVVNFFVYYKDICSYVFVSNNFLDFFIKVFLKKKRVVIKKILYLIIIV